MARIEDFIKEIEKTPVELFGENTPLVARYFKKANKRANDILNMTLIGDGFEEISKFYSDRVKTPALFEGMDFCHYQTKNESQKNALKIVKEYFEKSEEHFLTGTNLLLIGNFGTGKSMLKTILCRKLAKERLFNCKYFNSVDLVCSIKDTFSKSSKYNVTEIVDSCKNTGFLFLDDIDKIKPTEYVQEIMYSIVNSRIEKESPTIISANHSLEELDKQYFGEAVISRLATKGKSKTIKFTHENWRIC